MDKLSQYWQWLEDKTAEISIRERLMVTLAALAVIYGIAELVFFEAVRDSRKDLVEERKSYQTTRNEYEKELRSLSQLAQIPKKKREQIAQLDLQIEKMEEEILGFADVMISPQQMTVALQEILKLRGGLKVKSLKNAAAIPIVVQAATETDSVEAPGIDAEKAMSKREQNINLGLFRHKLEVVLGGSFNDAKNFIQLIEAEKSNLYWESIEYEVLEYPKGELILRLFTLSREEEWLGV